MYIAACGCTPKYYDIRASVVCHTAFNRRPAPAAPTLVRCDAASHDGERRGTLTGRVRSGSVQPDGGRRTSAASGGRQRLACPAGRRPQLSPHRAAARDVVQRQRGTRLGTRTAPLVVARRRSRHETDGASGWSEITEDAGHRRRRRRRCWRWRQSQTHRRHQGLRAATSIEPRAHPTRTTMHAGRGRCTRSRRKTAGQT